MDYATGLLMFCEKIRSAVDLKLSSVAERISALENHAKGDVYIPSAEDIQRQIEATLLPYAKADNRDRQAPIVFSIDPASDCVDKTVAVHDGGLWLRTVEPDGQKCWTCVVDGVKDIVLEHDGERTVKSIVTLASGRVIERSVVLPTMIYKGVHQEDQVYVKGDSVTRKGSVWCCVVDETSSMPGDETADWQLAVKRGRDGKDAT